MDAVQQLFHTTSLVSLLLQSSNILFGVFLTGKAFTISRKIAVNFREVSLKVVLKAGVLDYFGEIL